MKLENIEKLIAEATPGPWEHNGHGGYVCFLSIQDNKPTDYISAPESQGLHLSKPDADFIAASRELMPKLLRVAKIAKLGTQRQVGWIDVEMALAELEK